MPTYAELLSTENWRTKRHNIIIRDKFLCQNCSNENIIKDCREGFARHYSKSPLIDISLSGFWLSCFVSDEGKFVVPEKTKVYYYFDDNKKAKAIAFKDLNDEYIYVPSLHVHHKYYQERLKPWEYPDEALITYCWVCHEQLHTNTQVPILDISGNDIGKMRACLRCDGAGIFPEFRHVHAGICFRCNGAKYEELIKGKTNSDIKYNPPTEDLPF